MKTSEAFKIARTNLWDGNIETTPSYRQIKDKYICWVLETYVEPLDREASERCQTILEDLLGENCTLEGWLVEKNIIEPNFYHKPNQNLRQKVQTTRKAWLTHLIEHYQALGD